MANITGYRQFIRFWYILIWLLILFALACSSKSEYAGIYRTQESGDEPVSELELKVEGEGAWRVGDNEETFTWYPKGNELRLNTKKGAVIVAKIQGDVLYISLSGGKKLSLKKIK